MKSIFPIMQRFGKSQIIAFFCFPIVSILYLLAYLIQSKIGSDYVVFCHLLIVSADKIMFMIPLFVSVGIVNEFTDGDLYSLLCNIISYVCLVEIIGQSIPGNESYHPGVIIGILNSIITIYSYNQFKNRSLPAFLGFFSGKRSIPIINLFFIFLVSYFIVKLWIPIEDYVYRYFNVVMSKHAVIGFGLYGLIERLLVPFGIHHIWNVPFMIGLGEYTTANGYVVHGELSRFITGDSSAGNMAGGYIFKMFGLPGAALAIYHTATENKKKIALAMTIAALTSFFSGITEPIEAIFMFSSPMLYVIHSIMAGTGYVLMEILHVKHSTSFSQGLIDYLILLPNAQKPYLIFEVGIFYFILYYSFFSWFILKFKINFFSHVMDEKNDIKSQIIPDIISSLGGVENIDKVDACITRLRISVFNPEIINKEKLMLCGAHAILIYGCGVQIVLGTMSEKYKQEILQYCVE